MRRVFTPAVVILIVAAWCGLGWALNAGQAMPGTVTATPQRIVSLTPDITEILFALGLGDRIVGVSTYCDYPPEAATKPVVGTYWEPDVEAIIACRPDLIAGERSSKSDVLGRLSRMGYQTAALKMDTVADLTSAITTLGELTDQSARGQELKNSVQAKLAAISALVAGKPRPKVLWIVQAEPLRVAGRETFINEIIERAGGQNAIGKTVLVYPPVGREQVLGAGVDVIIQPAMTQTPIERQQAQAIEQWKNWTTVPAVASKSIYVIPPDTVSRLGPRLPQGVELVARLLHPDCFHDSVKDSGK